jgi:Holliday junction DNA helicase RuvA
MINFLSGIIIRKTKQTITVQVGGIGYEIHLSPVHLVSLKVGDTVELFIHLRVRDDTLELYGLPTAESLDFFHMLLGVSGVGPKSALNILSLGTIDEIKNAIGRGDVTFLVKVSGIGKKTAERVVVELKEKVGEVRSNDMSGSLGDVVDALVGLGYKVDEARATVRSLDNTGRGVEILLKEALKKLVS